MNKKIVSGLLAGSLLIIPFLSLARETGNNSDTQQNTGDLAETQAEIHRSATSTKRGGENVSTTSSVRQEDEGIASSTASTTRDRGGAEDGQAEEHRSRIVNIVQSLLQVADRNGGIGHEVRQIANEEASSTASTTEAMDTLDHESGFKKFILGPDYKSLGDLRSSIVTTQNSIDRLAKARDRATSSTTKATLDAQIIALKGVASTTAAYVNAHENVFSLLGWFVRLFNK